MKLILARLQTKQYFSGAIILVYLAVADFLHIILGVKQENHGRSPKVENETYRYMFDLILQRTSGPNLNFFSY